MQSSSFVPRNTPYYRFDVRAKIILTVLMCIVSFLAMPLYLQYALAAAVLVFSLFTVGAKATMHAIRLIAPMLIFMVIFMPLQERSGTALLSIGSFKLITEEGFTSFQFFALRFIFISILFSLLLQTTAERDILPALRYFRLPYSASLVLSLAIRFIPEIGSVFNQIRESQRLRLPNPDDVNAKKRKIASLLPTLTSTLVVVLKNIPYSAAALEMRGYGRGNRRTDFHSLVPGRKVIFHFAAALIIPAVFICITIIL